MHFSILKYPSVGMIWCLSHLPVPQCLLTLAFPLRWVPSAHLPLKSSHRLHYLPVRWVFSHCFCTFSVQLLAHLLYHNCTVICVLILKTWVSWDPFLFQVFIICFHDWIIWGDWNVLVKRDEHILILVKKMKSLHIFMTLPEYLKNFPCMELAFLC